MEVMPGDSWGDVENLDAIHKGGRNVEHGGRRLFRARLVSMANRLENDH